MNILNFNSEDEMRRWLAAAQREAHNSLHQMQRAIGHGDHWVRFVDVGARLIEFGRVFTSADFGADDEQFSCDLNESGFLYGIAFSIMAPEGAIGVTHKAHVWPIEESLFNAASEVEWLIDALPVSAKINLEIAYRAMRSHIVGE